MFQVTEYLDTRLVIGRRRVVEDVAGKAHDAVVTLEDFLDIRGTTGSVDSDNGSAAREAPRKVTRVFT